MDDADRSATALAGIERLKGGCLVCKYGRSGKPHKITLGLSYDERILSWKGHSLWESISGKGARSCSLHAVRKLLIGRESQVFCRHSDEDSIDIDRHGETHLSLSLHFDEFEGRDTLDISFDNDENFGLVVAALRVLIPPSAIGAAVKPTGTQTSSTPTAAQGKATDSVETNVVPSKSPSESALIQWESPELPVPTRASSSQDVLVTMFDHPRDGSNEAGVVSLRAPAASQDDHANLAGSNPWGDQSPPTSLQECPQAGPRSAVDHTLELQNHTFFTSSALTASPAEAAPCPPPANENEISHISNSIRVTSNPWEDLESLSPLASTASCAVDNSTSSGTWMHGISNPHTTIEQARVHEQVANSFVGNLQCDGEQVKILD